MKAVEETIAAHGKPVFMQAMGDRPSPNVVVARWRYNGGEANVDPSDTLRIAMSLHNGSRLSLQSGSSASQAALTVGSVTVLPTHLRTQVVVQGEADVLQIFLRENFLDAAVDGQFVCTTLFDSHDSELQAAAMQLFVGATRGETDDSLLAESAVYRIAAHLLDRRERQARWPDRGGLGGAACRRVNDIITAALEDNTLRPPNLAQLATAASLSVHHFIRAFRQQTGVTPHRHMVLRRLERAIASLKKRDMSVAEVADDAGFATPAHFVATFRRTMGVTPGAFRKAVQR